MRTLILLLLILFYNLVMLPMFGAAWYAYALNLVWLLPVTIGISRGMIVRGEIPKKIKEST